MISSLRRKIFATRATKYFQRLAKIKSTVKMSDTKSVLMCKPVLSVLNAKIKKIWANLTIEPAIFLMSFALSLSGSTGSQDQLLIYKSCRIDFNETDETCHNLHAILFMRNIE